MNGDGLHRSINQKLFPDGCHLDPDTRIWCVSFAMRDISDNPTDTEVLTYVCKLPDYVRALPRPYWVDGTRHICTVAKHLKSTKVPCRYKERLPRHPGVISCVKEFTDYEEFLSKVANVIDNIISRPSPIDKIPMQPIISKGYGNYNYDYLVLKNACDKYGIKFNGSCMISLSNVPNLNSTEQVSPGNDISNQQYLETGIEHNIDDTIALNEYIYNNLDLSIKQINNTIRQQQINQDFASADVLK